MEGMTPAALALIVAHIRAASASAQARPAHVA
jgi:hypothetical protein